MPVFVDAAPPILICADLQVDHLTEGRRHVVVDGEAAIARGMELLALWRANLWPVMHVRRIARADWFDPASRLTDWVAEARPRPGEMTFGHPLPSAYSSARFADHLTSIRDVPCVLIGFSLDETILATVVEGFHRSHRYIVIADAVACRQGRAGDAAAYGRAMLDAVGNFATVQSGAALLRSCGAIPV